MLHVTYRRLSYFSATTSSICTKGAAPSAPNLLFSLPTRTCTYYSLSSSGGGRCTSTLTDVRLSLHTPDFLSLTVRVSKKFVEQRRISEKAPWWAAGKQMRLSKAEGLHPPPFLIGFALRPCVAFSSESRRCFFAAPRILNSLHNLYQRSRKTPVGHRQIFHRGLVGSGHGFGGFGSRERTTAGRLRGHQHIVLHSATGRNVSLHCTLTDRSSATHLQLLRCLWARVQVVVNAWDGT